MRMNLIPNYPCMYPYDMGICMGPMGSFTIHQVTYARSQNGSIHKSVQNLSTDCAQKMWYKQLLDAKRLSILSVLVAMVESDIDVLMTDCGF